MILSAIGVLAACTPTKNAAVGAGRATKSAAEATADKTNDVTISMAVKGKLSDDETVRARDIDVDTHGGVVYLKGTQPSEDAKHRAEQLATQTDGVIGVVNQLVVTND
jgi:hyperosmotically inducible periplasmic protein